MADPGSVRFPKPELRSDFGVGDRCFSSVPVPCNRNNVDWDLGLEYFDPPLHFSFRVAGDADMVHGSGYPGQGQMEEPD